MNTQVTVGSTSTLVLRPNIRRRRVILVNNSDEDMYICMNSIAVTGSGVAIKASGGSYIDEQIKPGDFVFLGQYTGICASGGKVLTIYEEDR